MGAAPWLRWLVAGLPPQRPGFHPMPVYVRFLVDEVAHGHFTSLKRGKSKAITIQAWTGPEGSRRLRLPDLKTFST
jgi:hypothetical protein